VIACKAAQKLSAVADGMLTYFPISSFYLTAKIDLFEKPKIISTIFPSQLCWVVLFLSRFIKNIVSVLELFPAFIH